MAKKQLKPNTLLYPLPAVLVTCGATEEEHNMVTVSWTGTLCSDPPMCYISLRPSRTSYGIIKKNKEFVINLTTRELLEAVDYAGNKSGKHVNKFEELGLTKGPSTVVNVPIIMESPVHIECVVKEIKELGCHHMFIAEIVSIQVNDYLVDDDNSIQLSKVDLLSYVNKYYFSTAVLIGKYGQSYNK